MGTEDNGWERNMMGEKIKIKNIGREYPESMVRTAGFEPF